MKYYTEEQLRAAFEKGMEIDERTMYTPDFILSDYEAVEVPAMPEKLTSENGAKALLMGEPSVDDLRISFKRFEQLVEYLTNAGRDMERCDRLNQPYITGNMYAKKIWDLLRNEELPF